MGASDATNTTTPTASYISGNDLLQSEVAGAVNKVANAVVGAANFFVAIGDITGSATPFPQVQLMTPVSNYWASVGGDTANGLMLVTGATSAGSALSAMCVAPSAVTSWVDFIDAAGNTQTAELSFHAASQAAARGITLDDISNAMTNGVQFPYAKGPTLLNGYYDPMTNTFVGLGDRITTVMNPSTPANYLLNLLNRK